MMYYVPNATVEQGMIFMEIDDSDRDTLTILKPSQDYLESCRHPQGSQVSTSLIDVW
jgi:hypothetical protein